MADDPRLADRLAAELGGRSLEWWKRKLHDYMRRAKNAEDSLAQTRTELAEAISRGDAAQTELSELQAQVDRLSAELRDIVTERDAATAEARRLHGEVIDLDLDAIFNQMVAPWEQAIADMEKEVGL